MKTKLNKFDEILIENEAKLDKIFKILFILGSVVIIIGFWYLLIMNFYVFVLYPSIQSHTAGCEIGNRAITGTDIEKYRIGGWYAPLTDEIVVLAEKNSPHYEITLKHEQCHQRQARQHRLYSCDNQIGSIINEMECYIMSGGSLDTFIKYYKGELK